MPQHRKSFALVKRAIRTPGKRWYEFGRSAFLGKFGHSGGGTYRDEYNDQGGTSVRLCNARRQPEPNPLSYIHSVCREEIALGFARR